MLVRESGSRGLWRRTRVAVGASTDALGAWSTPSSLCARADHTLRSAPFFTTHQAACAQTHTHSERPRRALTPPAPTIVPPPLTRTRRCARHIAHKGQERRGARTSVAVHDARAARSSNGGAPARLLVVVGAQAARLTSSRGASLTSLRAQVASFPSRRPHHSRRHASLASLSPAQRERTEQG